jgi:hypothetical protein
MTYFASSRPTGGALAVLLLFVLLAACGSSEEEPVSPEFAKVQAIFDARCVACHSPGNGGLTPGVQRYPELPLNAGRSYDALVGSPAHETCGGTLVVPSDPTASFLERKLIDQMPCEGGRMPLGEAIMISLPAEDIDTITAWIAAGAPR